MASVERTPGNVPSGSVQVLSEGVRDLEGKVVVVPPVTDEGTQAVTGSKERRPDLLGDAGSGEQHESLDRAWRPKRQIARQHRPLREAPEYQGPWAGPALQIIKYPV